MTNSPPSGVKHEPPRLAVGVEPRSGRMGDAVRCADHVANLLQNAVQNLEDKHIEQDDHEDRNAHSPQNNTF